MGGDTGSGWAQVVTWALVFVGWLAVHKLTLGRERRKEKRDAVRRLIEELKAMEVAAVGFHVAAAFDKELNQNLLWRVNRAVRSLQRPPLNILDIPLGVMVRFRKSITLRNADASSFMTQPPDGDLITDIRSATDDLVEAIEVECDIRFC